MNKISTDKAIATLSKDGIYSAGVLDGLLYGIEEGEGIECYSDETCLLIANTSAEYVFVEIEPTGNPLDAQRVLDFLAEKYNKVNIIINTRLLPPEKLEKVKTVFSKKYPFIGEINDFGYTRNRMEPFLPLDCVRLLTMDDKAAFCSMNAEPTKNRPPLPVLFTIFVQNGNGNILAYFEDNVIKGYLSFEQLRTADSSRAFDVDYIYVLPAYRGKGIGKKLAQSYLTEICNQHGKAFWSNAKNEASEKVAISTGFEIVRKAYRFQN